jgi:hypothetical protein
MTFFNYLDKENIISRKVSAGCNREICVLDPYFNSVLIFLVEKLTHEC